MWRNSPCRSLNSELEVNIDARNEASFVVNKILVRVYCAIDALMFPYTPVGVEPLYDGACVKYIEIELN